MLRSRAFTACVGFAIASPTLAPAQSTEPDSMVGDALPINESVLSETGPLRTRIDIEPEVGFLERILGLDPERLLISGEFREQYESWRNREFGLIEESDDDYLLQRLYLDFDYRPRDDLRLFVELGSAFQFATPFEPGPVDEDPAFIQQAFVEVARASPIKTWSSRAQVGRQTFSLGSGRLVATRNGPNIRRSFDAARLIFAGQNVDGQILVGSEVSVGGNEFDNEPDDDPLLWGTYWTVAHAETGGGLDLYYLGYRDENATFDSTAGVERRHSFGLRSFGAIAGWDWNVEPVL